MLTDDTRPFFSSPTIAAISVALAKAQGQIKFAKKSSRNPAFGSAYADLSECWEAVRQPLSANELALIQIPQVEEDKVTVVTLLTHSSGEWIAGPLSIPYSVTRSNEAQAVGSAITYAKRYGLCAIVGVAPDEDDDGNNAGPHGVRVEKSTGNGAAKPSATPAKVDVAAWKKRIDDKVQDAATAEAVFEKLVAHPMTPKQRHEILRHFVDAKSGHFSEESLIAIGHRVCSLSLSPDQQTDLTDRIAEIVSAVSNHDAAEIPTA